MGSPRDGAKSWSGALVTLAGFALVIGLLDAFVVRQLVGRARTYAYPPVQAEVVESYVEESTDHRDQPVYQAVVRYRYVVGGQSFEGTFTGREEKLGRGEAAAAHTVEQHPHRRPITVFRDPAAPERSVVARGILGEDLFLVLFAVPFNLVVGAIGWTVASALVADRRPADVAGPGVRVREVGGRLHVRLPAAHNLMPPLAVAAGTALASTVLTVVGTWVAGTDDVPHWLPISGLWWTLLAGVYAYGQSNPVRARRRRGDLVVDAAARTITLPPAGRGAAPEVIAFDRVVNVRGAGWAGGNQPRWARGFFHPTITWRAAGRGTQSANLGSAVDRPAADRFARWLEKQVGLRK